MTQNTQPGREEGDVCGIDGCEGLLTYKAPENCSCHISPPCNACVSVELYCPDCHWEEGGDQ